MKHLAVLLLCWSVTGLPFNVVDGDTFDARIKVWQQIEVIERIRVLGIDTPEMWGADRERGQAAKAFAAAWLEQGLVTLISCARDSFGRVIARVSRGESVLADELKAAGHEK